MSDNEFESPLVFPDMGNERYWTEIDTHDSNFNRKEFNMALFSEDYESCLVELSMILEKIYDPVLQKKIGSLLRGVEEWLK